MAKNVYLNLTRAIDRLPKHATIGNTTLTKTVPSEFSKGMKQYCVSGEKEYMQNCIPQLELVEEYFNKCSGYFEKVFSKITKTKPEYADRGLVITREGKGLRTVTTVNSEGIRQMKVVRRLSKDGTHYDCTRYIYNDNGTKPEILSTWTELA